MKYDYFQFLESPSLKKEFIVQWRAGTDELTNQKQQKLLRSILAKVEETDYPQIEKYGES